MIFCFIYYNILYFSLVKRSVSSPVGTQAIHWLQHYLSVHQLSLCNILTNYEMELTLPAPNQQPLTNQELWQHVWLANHLLQTLNYEEGLCRVVVASERVSAALFAQVVSALVCKGKVLECLFFCLFVCLIVDILY